MDDVQQGEGLQVPVFHGGMLLVSDGLMQQAGISFDGCGVQGDFKEQGVFSKLREALLLPESITIRGIFLDIQCFYRWLVLIEGETLPEVHEMDEYPRLEAVYRHIGLQVRLINIRPYESLQAHFSSIPVFSSACEFRYFG